MLSNDGFRLIGVVYVIIGITFGYNLPILLYISREPNY